MELNEELLIKQKRYDVSQTDEYKYILEEMKNKLFYLSNPDEKELKGMIKLVKWVMDWEEEYKKLIKNNK